MSPGLRALERDARLAVVELERRDLVVEVRALDHAPAHVGVLDARRLAPARGRSRWPARDVPNRIIRRSLASSGLRNGEHTAW